MIDGEVMRGGNRDGEARRGENNEEARKGERKETKRQGEARRMTKGRGYVRLDEKRRREAEKDGQTTRGGV